MKGFCRMGIIGGCVCENCGRSSEIVEIEQLTLRGHVAQVCVTCVHILSQTTNEKRFFQLVRRKNSKDSNPEMKKIHQLMSALIAVGMLMIVTLVTFGVVQNLDTFQGIVADTDALKQTHDYMSFALLNQFK